ncbi:MAG: hypothetical protein LBJ89_02615 [Holosporales bacterium]|jgi:hypothetical protein|nr:hypothetical protein [Holosporales bacterium]
MNKIYIAITALACSITGHCSENETGGIACSPENVRRFDERVDRLAIYQTFSSVTPGANNFEGIPNIHDWFVEYTHFLDDIAPPCNEEDMSPENLINREITFSDSQRDEFCDSISHLMTALECIRGHAQIIPVEQSHEARRNALPEAQLEQEPTPTPISVLTGHDVQIWTLPNVNTAMSQLMASISEFSEGQISDKQMLVRVSQCTYAGERFTRAALIRSGYPARS